MTSFKPFQSLYEMGTEQKDKPVAVYCRSGKRSKKAAAILSKKGYIIYDLDKGFIGWEEADKEVEK